MNRVATRVKDINGVAIYEGDKVILDVFGKEGEFEIKFDMGAFWAEQLTEHIQFSEYGSSNHGAKDYTWMKNKQLRVKKEKE